MKKQLLSLGVLALLPGVASAGELRPDRVPAEARWLLHVDAEAARNTTLWHMLQSGAFGDVKAEMEVEFSDVRTEFGIDPVQDLLSVTVYGFTEDPEQALAIVEATSSVDAALERAKQEEGYQAIGAENLTVHSWGHEGERLFAYVHPEGQRRIVLFAHQSQHLTDGIRMLHGAGESLATRGGGITARPQQGSIFFFAASDQVPGMGWAQHQSELAGLVKGITVDAGERTGQLFARVAAVTDEVEQASQIRSVIDGFRAMGLLAASASKEIPAGARNLIDAVRVQQHNREVVLEFSYDFAALIREVESMHNELQGDRSH